MGQEEAKIHTKGGANRVPIGQTLSGKLLVRQARRLPLRATDRGTETTNHAHIGYRAP